MRETGIRYDLVLAAIVVTATAVGALAYPLLPPESRQFWYAEGGFVELATLLFYAVAAAMFLFGPYYLPRWKWLLALICVLFALREIDILPAITDGGFLFFPENFKRDFPLAYQVLEAVAIAIAALVVLAAFWLYRNVVRENLARRDRHQYMMLAGWAFVAVAILLDGLATKIEELSGYRMSGALARSFEGMEETIEAMIPLAFIFGLLHYYRERRRNLRAEV